MFDSSQEDENPINPIYGQSVLKWIKEKTSGLVQMNEPTTEDWGWYSYAEWEGRKYLIGASAEQKSEDLWCLQIEKQRTFMEGLCGKEKMTRDDGYLQLILSTLKGESQIKDVELE
ncbi:MAG: hypothetical protein AB8C40_05260 [Gammaproteobacteria bacterium]